MAARRSWLPIVAALLMGLAAAMLAQNWLKGRVEAAEAQRLQGVPVVIAAREIQFGERIGQDDVTVIAWPHDHVPEGVLGEVAAALGKVSNQRIIAGEPILQARIVQQAGGSSLASLIEPDMRAVTVRVNDVIGVAGFLLPGNRVDVLATRVDQKRRAKTRTLLTNIKVMAVDQTAMAEKDKPLVVRAVTLQVEPREAERLVQATEEGTVQLALRNPDDGTVSVVAEEDEADEAPPPPPPPPRRAAAPRKAEDPSVTVIRQTQVGKQKD